MTKNEKDESAVDLPDDNDLSPASGNESDDQILTRSRKQFEQSVEYESAFREVAEEDNEFYAGEQWDMQVKQERYDDSRPCLTINRLPEYVRVIANDQRQNPASIKISPCGNGATLEIAKIYQGLCRHIEYASDADIAYSRAFTSACKIGLGWIRILTEYENERSFNLNIVIKSVRNPFSVYADPNFEEPDGKDQNFAHIIDEMSAESFRVKYPNANLSRMADWGAIGDQGFGWINPNSVRIAEYYYKIHVPEIAVQLSDGSTALRSELPKKLPNGISIVGERETSVPHVKWVKHNGIEILEKTDVPTKWIPLVPVFGDETILGGKRILEGIIRHAKDAQKMYNIWASAQTETIGLAPKAPYVGYAGQFKGYERQWREANIKNHPYLEVNPITISGQPAPLPQRNVYEPPIQAISAAKEQSAADIQATTGIYDPTLGAMAGEDQSGIAIQRRNTQAQISNFHLIDNLRRSIRQVGRINVDLIPHIYDAPRQVRILHPDNTPEIVLINQEFQGPNGEIKMHDLSVGEYDVAVSEGASYQTQREETVSSLMQLMQAYPACAQIISDLLVGNMDFPAAQQAAERLKKMLPPQLQDQNPQMQMSPQAQQILARFQQQNSLLQQELQKAVQLIETKKLDIESRERIAMMNNETQVKIALMKVDAAHAEKVLDTEINQIDKRLENLNFNEPVLGNEPGAQALGNQSSNPSVAQAIPGQNQPSTGGLPPG